MLSILHPTYIALQNKFDVWFLYFLSFSLHFFWLFLAIFLVFLFVLWFSKCLVLHLYYNILLQVLKGLAPLDLDFNLSKVIAINDLLEYSLFEIYVSSGKNFIGKIWIKVSKKFKTTFWFSNITLNLAPSNLLLTFLKNFIPIDSTGNLVLPLVCRSHHLLTVRACWIELIRNLENLCRSVNILLLWSLPRPWSWLLFCPQFGFPLQLLDNFECYDFDFDLEYWIQLICYIIQFCDRDFVEHSDFLFHLVCF